MRRGPRSNAFRLGRARKTAKDLTQAMKDIISMSHASEEERERRLEACEPCEHRKGNRCNLCGCFINYKAKLKNSECPIGNWSDLLPESPVNSPSEENTSEEDTHCIH